MAWVAAWSCRGAYAGGDGRPAGRQAVGGRRRPEDPAAPRPLLFEVGRAPEQRTNLADQGLAEGRRPRDLLVAAPRELQAPAEQFERLGLAGLA